MSKEYILEKYIQDNPDTPSEIQDKKNIKETEEPPDFKESKEDFVQN